MFDEYIVIWCKVEEYIVIRNNMWLNKKKIECFRGWLKYLGNGLFDIYFIVLGYSF